MEPLPEVHEGYTFPLNPVWPVRDKGWWAAGLKHALQEMFTSRRQPLASLGLLGDREESSFYTVGFWLSQGDPGGYATAANCKATSSSIERFYIYLKIGV